jgi:hypothetical protein
MKIPPDLRDAIRGQMQAEQDFSAANTVLVHSRNFVEACREKHNLESRDIEQMFQDIRDGK